MDKIKRYSIEKSSGSPFISTSKIVRVVKKRNVKEESLTIIGDAPKNVLRIYEYRKGFHRNNFQNWSLYIAKVGHKWYPNESITEYLLYRLGVAFGLNMSDSSLAMINGQLRFLSKYFLYNKSEELIHGADVFSAYLDDRDMVEEIERMAMSRDLFTLQFVEKAIIFLFPYDSDILMSSLVKLLLFDALVGNNDRHFYNWGIVRSLKPTAKPVFSPIYDTARGLFWNDDDDKLVRMKSQMSSYIERYCKNSRPKLGWENMKNLNHFDLVTQIYKNEFYIAKEDFVPLFSNDVYDKMCQIIDAEFVKLFTPVRISFIKACLKNRFKKINQICQ